MLTILTDHKWRNFKYDYEVPKRILANEFDYQDRDETSDGFFRYRRSWYHIDQFMQSTNPEFKEWHGYLNHSFFSGVLIKLSSDGEQYQVATFYS